MTTNVNYPKDLENKYKDKYIKFLEEWNQELLDTIRDEKNYKDLYLQDKSERLDVLRKVVWRVPNTPDFQCLELMNSLGDQCAFIVSKALGERNRDDR